jgi:hypothetical protein
MLADQLKGELSIDYPSDGLEVRFVVPMANLRPQAIEPGEFAG